MKLFQNKKGLVRRPLELRVLPWIFLLAPLFNLLGWWILDLLQPEPSGLMTLITANYGSFDGGEWGLLRGVFMLLMYLMGIASAIGLWVVRPWGFWLCVSYGLVAWFTSSWIFVLVTSTHQVLPPAFAPFTPAALTNLLFYIPIIFLLQRDLVGPFFESHLRFWEQYKLLRINLPLEVDVGGSTLRAQTFDLSLHSCFLVDVAGLPKHTDLSARFDLGDGEKPIEIPLVVQWSTTGNRHYPAGIGFHFHHPNPESLRRLEAFLTKKLHEGHQHHTRANFKAQAPAP